MACIDAPWPTQAHLFIGRNSYVATKMTSLTPSITLASYIETRLQVSLCDQLFPLTTTRTSDGANCYNPIYVRTYS